MNSEMKNFYRRLIEKSLIYSVVLAIIGLGLMAYSFTMPVSIDGASVVNFSLMSDRQNTLILGGFLFVGGVVISAVMVYLSNQSKYAADDSDEYKIDTREEGEIEGNEVGRNRKKDTPRVDQIPNILEADLTFPASEYSAHKGKNANLNLDDHYLNFVLGFKAGLGVRFNAKEVSYLARKAKIILAANGFDLKENGRHPHQEWIVSKLGDNLDVIRFAAADQLMEYANGLVKSKSR